MCVGSLAGVTYLRYTVLTRSKKTETAVHCCDPALSVIVLLVSRNVFHVVSALQSIAFIHILFWLIRSLIDPTFAVFIVSGPLQLVTHLIVSECVNKHISRSIFNATRTGNELNKILKKGDGFNKIVIYILPSKQEREILFEATRT